MEFLITHFPPPFHYCSLFRFQYYPQHRFSNTVHLDNATKFKYVGMTLAFRSESSVFPLAIKDKKTETYRTVTYPAVVYRCHLI